MQATLALNHLYAITPTMGQLCVYICTQRRITKRNVYISARIHSIRSTLLNSKLFLHWYDGISWRFVYLMCQSYINIKNNNMKANSNNTTLANIKGLTLVWIKQVPSAYQRGVVILAAEIAHPIRFIFAVALG